MLCTGQYDTVTNQNIEKCILGHAIVSMSHYVVLPLRSLEVVGLGHQFSFDDCPKFKQ